MNIIKRLKFKRRTWLKYYSQGANNLLNKNARFNDFNVQMLPSKMFNHLFPKSNNKEKCNKYLQEEITTAKINLKNLGLLNKNPETISNIDFELPKLQGKNLDEHFKSISQDQSKVYFSQKQLTTSSTKRSLGEKIWMD